jgi:hypothetical protein
MVLGWEWKEAWKNEVWQWREGPPRVGGVSRLRYVRVVTEGLIVFLLLERRAVGVNRVTELDLTAGRVVSCELLETSCEVDVSCVKY